MLHFHLQTSPLYFPEVFSPPTHKDTINLYTTKWNFCQVRRVPNFQQIAQGKTSEYRSCSLQRKYKKRTCSELVNSRITFADKHCFKALISVSINKLHLEFLLKLYQIPLNFFKFISKIQILTHTNSYGKSFPATIEETQNLQLNFICLLRHCFYIPPFISIYAVLQ